MAALDTVFGTCKLTVYRADKKTIKSAYRQLARKFHPDVNKQADAEDRFKDISAAYEVRLPPADRAPAGWKSQGQVMGVWEM